MRITFAALGTRGDVQPTLALARGIQAAGHPVQIIAGANFRSWIESFGFTFRPCVDMEVLMNSPEGIAWVEEPNQIKQLRHMKALTTKHEDEMLQPLLDAAPETDVYISGFVGTPFVQTICQKFGIRHINASLQPWRPTRSGAASIAAVTKADSPFNRLFGQIGERLILYTSFESANRLRDRLGMPRLSRRAALREMASFPIVYGFSRHVVPPPPDWDAHNRVVGYWFLDESTGYKPSDALQTFLDAGEPPVYVGFGSMSSSEPAATVKLTVEALGKAGKRGIIAAGWSGATADLLPDSVFLLDHAPHSWLFERVSAVVHHGGAGTTAAGLRAGKPTMIIPHFSDQPYWGRRVYELGVGVKPVPRHKLKMDDLANGIHALTTDTTMRAKAIALGAAIRAENGVAAGVEAVEEFARMRVGNR